MTLLPQIKVATQESVTKLTHRQLKVADLLKGGRMMHDPSGATLSPLAHRSSAGAGRLIQDNSMLTLGSQAGGIGGRNDHVASHKLFLTAAHGKDSPSV